MWPTHDMDKCLCWLFGSLKPFHSNFQFELDHNRIKTKKIQTTLEINTKKHHKTKLKH